MHFQEKNGSATLQFNSDPRGGIRLELIESYGEHRKTVELELLIGGLLACSKLREALC